MSDAALIPSLIKLATDPVQFKAVCDISKDELFRYDGEHFPTNACAITLSNLMQRAGADIGDIFRAVTLGETLKTRGWKVIKNGAQKPGDVGSTCGVKAAKNDHIYLVVQSIDTDKMRIVDNQVAKPHYRCVSGKDCGYGEKTPTKFFLRAT